jgi:hypothetical protein
VRYRSSARIKENRTVLARYASGPRELEEGGAIIAASPGVLGVIVPGQRGRRRGMVSAAVVPST